MNERQRVAAAADFLRARLPRGLDVAVVLGTGPGGCRPPDSHTEVATREVPHLPTCGVEGHAGRLEVGQVDGCEVGYWRGRVHLYEGHAPADVVRAVRVSAAVGARALVVTNAAGGIREDLTPGDFLLLRDHLNLTGENPLAGPAGELPGERFLDLTEAYDAALRGAVQAAAEELGQPLPEGVYAAVRGPSFETPAEVNMLATLGADAVGMSTVLEVIAARHLGLRVLGLSCITNAAAGRGQAHLGHADVLATANRHPERNRVLLETVIRQVVTLLGPRPEAASPAAP